MKSKATHVAPSFMKCFFAALLVLSGFFFFEAAKRPLASPDEGRYSEIPREMVVSGDYLTPRLNTVKYFEKPPLFYWMQAATIKALGTTDFAARFMNVLMTILGCLITLWAGWFLFSPRTGVLSCAVLASSLLYYGISRIVILDMAVSVFITGALFSMIYALTKGSQRALYAAYIFCALGTMTKGVIGFGIPGAVILSWILLSRQWPLMGRALTIKGILLFLAIVARCKPRVCLVLLYQ
jgi:4-amino-4-deoxy-L-arabinose transferase-like glycosyltransferase